MSVDPDVRILRVNTMVPSESIQPGTEWLLWASRPRKNGVVHANLVVFVIETASKHRIQQDTRFFI